MKPGRTARLAWREDFWEEHRTKQTLVLACPVDTAHTVGELRGSTDASGRWSVHPVPDGPVRPGGSPGRLRFDGPGNRRIRWTCRHCLAAGRRSDDKILQSEPLIRILQLMEAQGPPHATVVLEKPALKDVLERLPKATRRRQRPAQEDSQR